MDELNRFWDEYGGIILGSAFAVCYGLAINHFNKKAQEKPPKIFGLKKIYKTNRFLIVTLIIPAAVFAFFAVLSLIMKAPIEVSILFLIFALGGFFMFFFYLKSYLVIENNTLTFHSWRGSTTINWSDIKQARTKWRSAIVLDTTEGTFLFRQGWIGMNDFVEQLFENVPMERIGTKNDFKEILAK